MTKFESFLKNASITAILALCFVAIPYAFLNKWVAEHTKPVAHVEYLENNVMHYLRTFPNKQKYIDYVNSYHVGNTEEIVDKVLLTALYQDLDPKLLFAIAASESSFNVDAKSCVGAKGLLQVMPFWKEELGKPNDNLHDLRVNLHYGSTILKIYLEKSDNDMFVALSKYNGSVGSDKYPLKIFAQTVWSF